MDAARNLIFELQRPDPSPAWADRQRRKILGGSAEISRLIGGKRNAVGGCFTLADVAVPVMLTMFDFLREQQMMPSEDVLDWREHHPDLSPYVAEHERRPSFQATRPRMMEVDLKEAVG